MEKTWKDFVVMLCNLGATNSSKEIAQILSAKGETVSTGQVAAVKANHTRGAYKG